MPRRIGWLAVGLLIGFGIGLVRTPPVAQAQRVPVKATPKAADPVPDIDSILPPSAQVGEVTEVTLTGRNLNGVDRWIVSGSGVETLPSPDQPLRRVLAALALPLPADGKQPGTKIKLRLKVAADAEPGVREVRGAGVHGVSNVALLRIDTLPQTLEDEPNDTPDKAGTVAMGSAVVGVLKPQDVDYYRVEGRQGQRVVLDLEAQRIGTAISPVVTLMTASGAALAQARDNPGAAHDCRLPFRFPADGMYLIEVRDNVYSGADTATYRLRVDAAHFATGLFPLGGPRGQTITVTASGGDLPAPLTRQVKLPDDPGAIVEPGPFEGPGGPVLPPGRLVVGDGPEIHESAPGPDGQSVTPLAIGTTANGRIDKPGEVDRYTVAVKKGERIHVRVQAAPLGSWLDSVVTIRDDKRTMLAENDDPGNNNNQRRGGLVFGLAETPPDSRLDYDPKADGTVTIEVTDRYGDGGPEYAYRLDVGSAFPDFSISLLLVNPNVNRGVAVNNRMAAAGPPGASGAFNLKPGARQPVNFLITPEGFSGTIEVKAEGLPPGVTSAPVPVRIAGSARANQPSGGFIELRADPNAEPALGELRLVATGKTAKGETITRSATAMISFNPLPGPNRSPFGGPRPVTRILTHLPVAVIEGPRMATAGLAKAGTGSASATKKAKAAVKRAPLVALKDLAKPPPLLQGGSLDLPLTFDPPDPDPESFRLTATAKGKGLLIQTIVVDNINTIASEDEDETASSKVRIQAAVDAELGARPLLLTLVPAGGKKVVKELVLDVRAPVEVKVAETEPIRLAPGGKATLAVSIKREDGYTNPVDLELADLPRGVKVVGSRHIPRKQTKLDVQLEMEEAAEAIAKAVPFRVIAIARMPRGPVRVDSVNRPMVISPSAEK